MNVLTRLRRRLQPDAFIPEPGCQQCNTVAHVWKGDTATYNYQFKEAGFGVLWRVDLARKIANARLAQWRETAKRASASGLEIPPGPLLVMPAEDVEHWLTHYASDLNHEHAMHHISPGVSREPGLLLTFTVNSVDPNYRALAAELLGTADGQTMLIDGNHRMWRQFSEGNESAVYVLSSEDQRLCFGGFTTEDVPDMP